MTLRNLDNLVEEVYLVTRIWYLVIGDSLLVAYNY